MVFDLGVAIVSAFASGGAPGNGLLVWGVVGFAEAELLVWLFGLFGRRRVGMREVVVCAWWFGLFGWFKGTVVWVGCVSGHECSLGGVGRRAEIKSLP